MSSGVAIRPYERRDRVSVRAIACETADRGHPAQDYLEEHEVLADFLTRYYTDYEPQTIWVAESQGAVIGYLTGCLDSRRYRRIMGWRVVPQVGMKAIAHGVLGSRQTVRLLQAAITTWRAGGFRRQVPLKRYPAHFHINIRESFRGRAVGPQLLARFIEHVQSAGLGGLHAAVREDNRLACRFFERMGFTVLSRHAVTMPDGAGFSSHVTLMYGRQV